MPPFSEYTDEAILNAVFGNTSSFGVLGSAPTIYVGVSSTTPAAGGAGVTEPSAGGYARVGTTAADWNAATAASPSVVSNASTITFPTATADWLSGANLTYVVFYDAATGGNLLGFGALATPKPVLNGDTLEVPAGDLSSTLA